MAKFKLSDKQWDELDRIRFSTTDAKVFRNATIVLMSSVGRAKKSIAKEMGCSPATVDYVRKRFRDAGLKGLAHQKRPGRPSRATPEYRAALRAAVATQPQSLGFGFSVWSVARLANYLKQRTGVALSADQLRRIMHEEQLSYQRPKHTMKGKRDEVRYKQAQSRLKRLKRGPSRTMTAMQS